MISADSKKLKKSGFMALFWAILAILMISGSSFAWFTFNSKTNVTPIAGVIGSGGADLTIADSEDGPFLTSCDLPISGASENLFPVSTFNMTEWFTATSQNSGGYSNKFVQVTDTIDEMTMFGTVYLKTEGGACDVYFDQNTFQLSGNAQLLASGRLGVIITSPTDGEHRYIFHLDTFMTEGAESRETVSEKDSVILSVNSDQIAEFAPDPSVSPVSYCARLVDNKIEKGEQKLFHLEDGDIAKVEYRIYIEGCDENSINQAQDKNLELELGFIGVGL